LWGLAARSTMGAMSSSSFRTGPGEHEASWANETLPLSVRKELLERELKKLGFRRAEGARGTGSAQQQQQPQPAEHPQADGAAATHGE
jgi:hypothetical protein